MYKFNICILVLLLEFANVEAQEKAFSVFGYTANIPNQLLGFCFYKLNYKKNNIYLDAKFTSFTSIKDNLYSDISVNKAENIFQDRLLSKKDDWFSLNIGLTKTIRKEYTFYAAAGFTSYSQYREYKDDIEILGDHGNYWIEDDNKSKIQPNFLIGALIFFREDWIGQIGLQAVPKGISFGIGKGISFQIVGD